MKRQTHILTLGGVICAALFAFAYVAAPASCEWGLTAYFWSGVASVLALFVMPAILQKDRSVLRRVALGLGLATLGVVVWFVGLEVANVRILCRLF